MKRPCEYCQNDFEASRKDKRYCSNSCKQFAYMQRMGNAMGSVEPLKRKNVNTSSDQNVNTSKRESVKPSYDQNVNTPLRQSVNAENRQNVKPEEAQMDMNALLKELKGFIQETVNESMGKIKALNSQTVIEEKDQNVNTSRSQSVMPLVEDEPVMLDLEEESSEEEDLEESSRQNIKPLPGKNANTPRRENVNTSNERVEESAKEESMAPIEIKVKDKQPNQTLQVKVIQAKEQNQYQPYSSEFLDDIFDHINLLGRDILFLEKERSFPGRCKQVGWVSVRYRSLLENVLTLSEMNRVDLSDLVEVANAFTLLIRSKSYAELPDNYPYTDQIKILREKLRAFCMEHEDEERVPLRISPSLRSTLLLHRMELAQAFKKMPFCKLSFNEDKR